jgi:hypothetical protein
VVEADRNEQRGRNKMTATSQLTLDTLPDMHNVPAIDLARSARGPIAAGGGWLLLQPVLRD